MTTKIPAYCSFCGKASHEVGVMIAGPALVFICDECVALCVETIERKRADVALEREVARCTFCTPTPVNLRGAA